MTTFNANYYTRSLSRFASARMVSLMGGAQERLARRRFLEMALEMAAAVAAGVATSCGSVVQSPQSSEPPTPEARRLSENERVINEKAKSLNLTRNSEEVQLWNNLPREFGPQLAAIRKAMRQSKNKSFQQTVTVLDPLFEAGEVSFTEVHDLTSYRNVGETQTYPEVLEGKLHWHIYVSREWLSSEATPLQVALAITREVEKLQIYRAYQRSLDLLTPQQRTQEHQKRMSGAHRFVAEEARGYAREAQAYVNAYGLGVRSLVGSPIEARAANFIRFDSNAYNQAWQNYLQKFVLAR